MRKDSLQPVTVPPSDPVRVRKIVVRSGRLSCEVLIADARFRHTTPGLAAHVARRFPDLARHACVNSRGNTFGAVIERTSVPHLLEHLVISLQTRASAEVAAAGSAGAGASGAPSARGGSEVFVGTTEWLDEKAGVARVQVSFKDDLEALRAFNEALKFLNTAVVTCLA